MSTQTPNLCEPDNFSPDAWPHLASLGLGRDELAGLASQGFLSAEPLPSGTVCYKLRFRHSGRQRVCYLGVDAALAQGVRHELAKLQAQTRADRQLRRLYRQTQRQLRETCRRLQLLLAEAGFHFHGLQVRRRRSGSGQRAVRDHAARGAANHRDR